MPLPSAPASISLNQVNVELGLSGTATITLNDAAVRTLFGVPSGQISMSQGYDKANFWKNTTKGFNAAGIPGNTAAADRTTYSSETTAAVPGANLSAGRNGPGSAGNSTKAFFVGGFNPINIATADRTTFSSETTAAVPGANLSVSRARLGGAGNSTKAFFLGGFPGTVSATVTADRTTYSSETTAAVPGANLSTGKGYYGSAGNADKGFWIGGGTSIGPGFGQIATTDRTTYSTEATAAVPGANLPAVQGLISNGAVGNSTKGFIAGGYLAPAFLATTNRTTFSSETTAAVPGANLSAGRYNSGGISDTNKGFFSGGINAGGVQATTDRTTFSSETTAAVPGANLPAGRGFVGAA